jgi:hypothetical protein
MRRDLPSVMQIQAKTRKDRPPRKRTYPSSGWLFQIVEPFPGVDASAWPSYQAHRQISSTGRIDMKPLKACLPIIAALCLVSAAVPARAEPLKNIVLVHGAWVDASGWKAVYDHLIKDGFKVTMCRSRKHRSRTM